MLGFNRFSLLTKILFVAIISFIFLTTVLFILYGFNMKNKTVESYISKARAISLTAESARQEIEKKWEQEILTIEMLREFAAKGEKEKVLGMVPVVSAWNAAMRKAEQGGYVFRVPKFSPRRPENEPDYGSDYKVEGPSINKIKQENLTEYYLIDKKINAVRYFLPVKLTENCMICHGDPVTSKALWGTDSGKDPTGGIMENWKVGEIHGAFEVIQYLGEADIALIKDMSAAGVFALAGILIAIGIFFVIISNNVVNPIKKIITGLDDGSTEVAEASSNVSGSSQYLADGASSQAAAIEEISSALEEISSMTKMNASHATSADKLMVEANEIVKKANAYMEHLTESMDKIMADSEETSKIIKTIDEIAFQTNILAINAAVEAARAGEAGAGFAVVSDEVRALALRAALAANSTTGLIENNLKSTEDGTRIVKETGEAFTRVSEVTSQASSLVSEIATSSKEQAMGTEQVNKSIADVDKVTQNNAATAEESAASSEELNAQAETMSAYVRNLRKIITGKDVVKKDRANRNLRGRSGKVKEIKPEKILPLSDDIF